MQNVFPKGKEIRIISIKAQYMVLFKNPRDNTQVVNLPKHMYPGRVKYMHDDRVSRRRHSHGALVTDATAMVIHNGALYGTKYNLGCPYRAMTILRGEGQQTC